MGKGITTFGDDEIGKQKFHSYKNPFFKNIDICNTVISNIERL